MKRTRIPGGAGFLGFHFCDGLLKNGHDVLGADSFFAGSKTNIEHLISNSYFELIRHGVTFPL